MALRIRSLALARSIAGLLPWRNAPPRRRLIAGVSVVVLAVLAAGIAVGVAGGSLIARLWTHPGVESEHIP
ncbi:MAG: hypothetical protein U1E62_22325 [Alsobacter sp.]